jgi:hypothetical protein
MKRYDLGMARVASQRDLKEALMQSLRDNREAVRDLLAEVMEDVALAHAIREGEKTRRVKRNSVIKALTRRK